MIERSPLAPVLRSIDFLEMAPSASSGRVRSTLSISNITSDADLGALTDLTLLSAQISGADAGMFSLLNFAAGSRLNKGGTFDLASLWDKGGDKKVVVVFYRGGWCPHCKKQLGELQSHIRDFTAAGAVIEPDGAALSMRTFARIGLVPEWPVPSVATARKS